ncbi:CerR family C-terminal domain-containing protein [Chelativorans salis]|uniref:CerR family C-terminal domain-containing protein n=1 Tax=Chelativorans salis TaxID=2978478 RepID=A0ABT2LNJ0_9HYPH|nr:CerR family C-terminal domain-containing protein [Chelativorans sp. EGI FJ00035]MCT7376130.1 CerR family C-terminal domain-containing protein [Chelativorans sp. EGI FJ00035]
MTEQEHDTKEKVTRLTSAERTREALIRAGLRLFGEKGFEAASTRELAAAAGANIGSIAYHFGGKEGLHGACADYIVDLISSVAEDALGDVAAPQTYPASPRQARAMLGQALQAMFGFIVQRPEAGEIVQFILREMTHPTTALDTIYAGVFEPVHKRLCGLWEAATGEPAESERTKITVFTLIGQVVYFRIGREAVKRRMGWREIGQPEAAAVVSVASGNLSAILDAREREKS